MTHAQKFNIKHYLKPKKARSLQIYWGLRFLKNHKRIEEGSKDFLVKMGGNPYIQGVVNKSVGNYCFSLVIYGFCSNNVLYSASLSFKMFIFLLTPSDTRDCYYLGA